MILIKLKNNLNITRGIYSIVWILLQYAKHELETKTNYNNFLAEIYQTSKANITLRDNMPAWQLTMHFAYLAI